MTQYNFGAGALWGVPLQDAFGAAIANPTPVQFGVLQDCSIEFSGDVKELFGQNQFAVAVGRGKMSITGKAKFGQINGSILNSLFFGQGLTGGIYAVYYDTSAGTAIPTTPFTITVTPPNSGTFTTDLGVKDTNGNIMTRVASAPTAGQYSVNASTGAYLFSSADQTAFATAGTKVLISYQYTATSTTAQKQTLQNIPMGYAPTFRADFFNQYNGKLLTMSLLSCVSTKLQLATKLDDFLVPELDFKGFANASNQVATWGVSDL